MVEHFLILTVAGFDIARRGTSHYLMTHLFFQEAIAVLSPEPRQECETYTCPVHMGFKCPTTPCVRPTYNCGRGLLLVKYKQITYDVVQGHLIRTPMVTCHCILSKTWD
jgi:hypothetical protein